MVKITSVFLTAVLLSACAAEDVPLETNLPVVSAALADPCAEQFVFQRELNGEPDDIYSESSQIDGTNMITQQYWYEGISTVVYFAYAPGEEWCNVWNENGVVWNH